MKLLQFYNEATVEPAKQTNVQHMTAVSNKQKRPEAIGSGCFVLYNSFEVLLEVYVWVLPFYMRFQF